MSLKNSRKAKDARETVDGSATPSTHGDRVIEDGLRDSQAPYSELDVAQLVQQMSKAAKARRESKRSSLEKQHYDRIEKTRAQIHAVHANYRDKISTIRQAQLEELAKLLEQKHEIEVEIVSSMQTIEQAHSKFSGQFAAILKGRVQELE
ncbi:MAG: hypothetical protein Q9165_002092 [Trypethelium subeluteriae]